MVLGLVQPSLAATTETDTTLATGVATALESSTSGAEATTPDETVTVLGRAQTHYKVEESELATGTPTEIARTPQSVQVINHTLIEDQSARQVTDLYRSISGVSQYSYSDVTFRGFRQEEIRYDGLRGDPFAGFAIPQLANIEEVQVLKGPASALFGTGEPGGLINYVTKQPTQESQRRIKVTGGNQDFAGTQLDMSGPLDDDGVHTYRLGFYQDHENPSRNNTDTRNRIFDLGYGWQLDDDTRLVAQYQSIKQRLGGARLRGIPTDDDGNFLADIDWNANEASDFQQLIADVYQLRLNHSFNDWLSGEIATRYYRNEETQAYHEPSALKDTDGDGVNDWVDREFRAQTYDNTGATLAGHLTAQLGDHTVLTGADYYRYTQDYVYYRATKSGGVTGLSLTNPQYGSDSSSYKLSLSKSTDTLSERYGTFIQDQWALTDRWDLLGGTRLDGYRDRVKNRVSGTEDEYQGTAPSVRLGSTYELSQQLRPYVVWSTGFVPQDAADQASSNGGPFDPEQSQLWEAGIRTYWLDEAVNLNLATYRIIKKNVLQTDPDDSDRMVAFGKVRSEGFEADLMADLTERWVMNLSYAYNDTRIKQAYDGFSGAVGDRFANAPQQQLGTWTRYDLPFINSAFSFGMNYVSDQLTQDGQTVKPYTVFDSAWQTRWQQWEVQLNVKNLFDREYAVSGFLERTGDFPGERRRVYLSLSREF